MRARFVAAIAAVSLVAGGAGTVGADAASAGRSGCKAKSAQPASVSKRALARSIKCLLNRKRARRDMKPLKGHREQRRAAKRHNRLMVRSDCFAHRCPGEGDLVDRLINANYLPYNGSWGVGENIAWGTGERGSPGSIVRAWMNSPPHRRNILDPDFRHIGIAVHRGTPVEGLRGGATYTTNFGYRR